MEYIQTFQLDSSSTVDAFNTDGSVGDLIQQLPQDLIQTNSVNQGKLCLLFGIMGGKGLSFF